MDRPKLELEINKATKVELVYDQPKTGKSSVGEWYLYCLRNGDGHTEYSYFAPPEVHQKLKNMRAGDEAVITLLAAQRGSKVVKSYEVKKVEKSAIDNSPQQMPACSEDEFLYTAMEKSLEQSIALAKKFNSVPIEKLAITLFIARTKQNYSFSN